MLYAIDVLSVLSMGALIIWHGTGRELAQLNVAEAVRAHFDAGADHVALQPLREGAVCAADYRALAKILL